MITRMIRMIICAMKKTQINIIISTHPPPPLLYTRYRRMTSWLWHEWLNFPYFSLKWPSSILTHNAECLLQKSMEAKRSSSKIIHNNNSPVLYFRKDKHQNQEKPIFAPSMDVDCLRVHIINSKLWKASWLHFPWANCMYYVICPVSLQKIYAIFAK